MRGQTTSPGGSAPPSRGLARVGQEAPPVASLPKKATPKRGRDGGRAKLFYFRVTEKERAAIGEAASKAGLAPGSYARGKLLGGNPPRAVRALPIERQALALLLAQIGRVGGNLNQLAKAGNSGLPVNATDVAPALADLRAIRDEIRALLGRKPL
jgi:Bacterial mobilisation protein (MobC)